MKYHAINGIHCLIKHAFLISILLHVREWSASRPGRFIPGRKSPGYEMDRRLVEPQRRFGRGG